MSAPIAAGTFSADDFAGDTVVVVPGVAVLELVLDAARSIGAAGVGELRLTRPIVLPDVGELDWQVRAGPLAPDGRRAVEVLVRRKDWTTHAEGELMDDPTADGRAGFADPAGWPTRTLADAVHRAGLVPVRWRDVEILPGATRAHVVWTGDRGRVWLADRHGRPVGYVDEVTMAPPDVEAVRTEPVEHVYRVAYREVAPTLRDAPAERVVVDLTDATDPVGKALTYARSGTRELVFLVDGSLACAPVRGLVRSLRAERPERTVRLVEARQDAAAAAVTAALDAVAPELVVAGNAFLEPELVPVVLTGGRPVLDPNGTVLITGGTGELGGLMAAHLVAAHGIRHLVLVSRRGQDAPGVADLVAELTAAGARTVRVMAADVADRTQVADVLAVVDPRHPLTAVLHLAGVVDARLIDGQDPARFHRVLAPKVSGAWHLHELTRHEPLAAFVLFSSVASVLGSAGQSNYAAANAYLDALATHRRAAGLPATSVSWGPWAGRGLSAYLGDTEVARLRRQGVVALTARQGRRVFDAAIAQDVPHLVAAVLTVPTAVAPERLESLSVEARWRAAVALVRREVAVVLGEDVGPRQVLGDAGVDSLMALELRTRLTAATAVPLPAALVADHPTPHAIARLLVGRLSPAVPREPTVGIAGAAPGRSAPETAWAALENAGIVPKALRGRRVGVFLGAPEGDVAGRVAELFRLRGPAVTVCGSPLVAVHLARVALSREECELALAGGNDGVLVLEPRATSSRAVLTDSALEGVGGGTMVEVVRAVTERRWAEVSGRGVRLTVEPTPTPRVAKNRSESTDSKRTGAEHGFDAGGRTSTASPSPGVPRWTSGDGDESRVHGGGGLLPVVVSGRDLPSLRRQAARWAEWLAARTDVSLAGVARTAALHRTRFRVRAVVLADSVAGVAEGLRAVAEGETHPRVVHGAARREEKVAFVSAGHSGPWVVPGLLRESRAFARTAARYDGLLRPLLGWSVVDVLAGDGELDLEHPEVVRVAGLVGRVALAAALRASGVVATGAPGIAVSLGPLAGGEELVRVLASVHVRGGPVDWERALPAGELVDLPPYSFSDVVRSAQ